MRCCVIFGARLRNFCILMADCEAIIDVLGEEDYQTRKDRNEDSHLLIEEPTERSQKV